MLRNGLVRKRWPAAMAVVTGLTALLSWLLLLDQGVSSARVIAAAATTVGAIISIIRFRREQHGGTEREV